MPEKTRQLALSIARDAPLRIGIESAASTGERGEFAREILRSGGRRRECDGVHKTEVENWYERLVAPQDSRFQDSSPRSKAMSEAPDRRGTRE